MYIEISSFIYQTGKNSKAFQQAFCQGCGKAGPSYKAGEWVTEHILRGVWQ